MKEYTVKITNIAYRQIQEIVSYISKDLLAPDAARKLLDKIENEIKELADMPQRYATIAEEPWKSEGVRKIIVNNFLIYYWIDEINKRVQVIGVIYQKRDQIAQLKKLEKE